MNSKSSNQMITKYIRGIGSKHMSVACSSSHSLYVISHSLLWCKFLRLWPFTYLQKLE